MARKSKRRGPTDPDAVHRMMMERRAQEAEIERLREQGATVKLDPARRIISAYRSNVFNLLLERKTITPNQHDAAYRLSVDWAAWKRLDGKSGWNDRVDGSAPGPREPISDKMLKAGRRVEAALSSLDPARRVLMEAFMVATVEEDRPMAWRGIVERVAGEKVRDKQAAMVVKALEELRAHYEGPQNRVAA